MSRVFGQTIQTNVVHHHHQQQQQQQRKALACISQNPVKNVLKVSDNNENSKSSKSSTTLSKKSSISIYDQENICLNEKQTLNIYDDDNDSKINLKKETKQQPQQQKQNKNQEELLQENIEAVKKELNNFLIDSLEKSHHDDNNDAIFNKSDKENNNIVDDMIVDDDDNENNYDNQKENDCPSSSLLSINSDISYVQHYNELELLYDYYFNIWHYMLEKERKFMPNPFYMSKQQHINTKMRSILIDWLVDVADEYKLKDETLFLTINYIDRFLSKYSITRQEFQLLGTSALFIATKYEEVYPPELADFVFITDDSYTKSQILMMEKTLLNGLSFDISVPTSNYFLEMFATTLTLDKQIYCLAKYLNLLTTLECTPFLKYYPSEIALCSILLSCKILKSNDLNIIFNDDFIQKSLTYEKQLGKQGDVQQLLKERDNLFDALNQLRLYANKHPQQAIQKKYSEDKFFNVSRIADEENIF